jgi:chromosome segregation ATPase
MATTMAPAAVVASATTPTLPSSPCGTSNDEFLKSLAALRQLLSVNYDALDDDIHSLRISKSILTTASSASLRLQQQQQSQQPEPPQSPPQQEVADEQSELESLRHHLEAANKDLEKERAERKQLEESHAQLVEENQGRSKQKEDLSTLKSLQEDLDIVRSRWKEEKDKAQRDQQKLKQALEQVAAERSQALQTVDVCQTKILSLQKQVRELQTQKDSQRDNWDLERNTLEETIHSWESAHRTLQRRLEEQAKVNEEVKDKVCHIVQVLFLWRFISSG